MPHWPHTGDKLLAIFPSSLQWRHNQCDGVWNHQPHDCLFDRLFRRRSKKTSKLHVTGLCEGNSPVAGEFPAQRASNAENVYIWWCYHSNLNVVEISFGSHPNSNDMITANFWAWRSSNQSVDDRGEVDNREFPAMLPMTLNWFLWNILFWYFIWQCNRNSD